MDRLSALVDAVKVERDRWAEQVAELSRERSSREEELKRLAGVAEAEKTARAEETAALRAETERLAEDAARLLRERLTGEQEVARLDEALTAARAELETLRSEAARLSQAEGELDQVYGSRSWRWTAPARLVWRLFERR
jgi:chromosome segregation ATPase